MIKVRKKNIYSARKKRKDIKQIKKNIIKAEHYKIALLLNDLTVSKFLTKKWIVVNNQVVNILSTKIEGLKLH